MGNLLGKGGGELTTVDGKIRFKDTQTDWGYEVYI